MGYYKKMSTRKIHIYQTDRVETGPLQFNDDWPGYFIRGDNAMGLILTIQDVLADPKNAIARAQLESFAKSLGECRE